MEGFNRKIIMKLRTSHSENSAEFPFPREADLAPLAESVSLPMAKESALESPQVVTYQGLLGLLRTHHLSSLPGLSPDPTPERTHRVRCKIQPIKRSHTCRKDCKIFSIYILWLEPKQSSEWLNTDVFNVDYLIILKLRLKEKARKLEFWFVRVKKF